MVLSINYRRGDDILEVQLMPPCEHLGTQRLEEGIFLSRRLPDKKPFGVIVGKMSERDDFLIKIHGDDDIVLGKYVEVDGERKWEYREVRPMEEGIELIPCRLVDMTTVEE